MRRETDEGTPFVMDRRSFITGAAAAGALAAVGGLAGCGNSDNTADATGSASTAAGTASGSDWLGTAPAITDADCVETVDTEVLVVGAGCSGYFASCFAADAGAKVLMIEKNPAGVAIRSSALGAIGTKKQAAVGAEINKEDIINDMAHYALNQCDIALMRQWADNSGEAIDWYCDLVEANGGKVQLEYNMPQGTRYKMWPTGHGTLNKESEVAEWVTKYLQDHQGCLVRTETAMQCLIKEGAKVVGVYATNADGAYIRINASKGVIICTGGYINNPEMYTALQGEEALKSLTAGMNFGTAAGDGIKACLWAGARMDDVHSTMIFDRGVVPPGTEIGMLSGTEFTYFSFSTQPWLKVNKSGRRITNESSPYDFLVHAAAFFPDRAWYPIWDSNWKEDVDRFHTIGCSTLISREGSNHHAPGVEAVGAQMAEMVTAGTIIQANTIAELAAGLGLDDAAAFEATVSRYNELYAAQYDSDFGKDPFRLSALKTPPFYGMRVGGLALCTLDGVRVNTDYQALDTNNEPIDGLYVLGDDSGGYYAVTYPNFGAGTNAGRCATSGMLCGRIVAGL